MISYFFKNKAIFKLVTDAQKMKKVGNISSNTVHQDWEKHFQTGPVSNQSLGTSRVQEQIKTNQLVLSAYYLICDYRNRGHLNANLDPLNLKKYKEFGKNYVKKSLQLDLKNNKILLDGDLDLPFKIPQHSNIFAKENCSFLNQKRVWTLRQIQKRLKQIYCGCIGLQSMHLSNLQERKWLMKKLEDLSVKTFNKAQKLKLLSLLTKVEGFSTFLNDKIKKSKRFSVQGLCSMISGLNQLIQTAVQNEVEYIGFGMAHRGRLDVLRNVFNIPHQQLFAEFEQKTDLEEITWGNLGDAKYHFGITVDKNIKDKKIRLSILPNPSHLQAFNPVVMGHVKNVQDYLNHQKGMKDKNVMSVLIHGDAAFAGQGVVYQCLQMGYLDHYNNYGIIHVIGNNQIGFTTTPAQARTNLYCTGVAKAIQAPIFHVNADEPEMVSQVMKIAVQYRQTFFKDIVVDIIGYRRYGHNNQDQPLFTQPMMYQEIVNRPNIYTLYKNKLLKQGQISQKDAIKLWDNQQQLLNKDFNQSKNKQFNINKWQVQKYYHVVDFLNLGDIKNTGICKDELRKIGQKITLIKQNFNSHPSIQKLFKTRRTAIQTEKGIDFALAQSLAFGSLLQEGFHIRMAGQDIQRGSFLYRHAIIVDQITQQKYMPLRNLLKQNEYNRIQIQNSHLSEYSALGFQYGYSITNPNCLTIWEAQFGDFSNGAQIIIDNYITTAQTKWNVQNGLVLNLPYDIDELSLQNSSARPQRYLQMLSQSCVNLEQERKKSNSSALRSANFSVVCISNAANLFHAYRRQMRRDYRKPLINLVSKKLLNLKQAVSSLTDLQKARFQTVIGERNPQIKPQFVKKVIICCGQSFYNVDEKRKQLQRNDVAIVRIEQLAPFDYEEFKRQIKKFSNVVDFVWFQEQHRNFGAWNYLAPRIDIALSVLQKEGALKCYNLSCISRRNVGYPVGKKNNHDEDQAQILKELFR